MSEHGKSRERSRSREIRCPGCEARISARDKEHLREHGQRLVGWRCYRCPYERPSNRSHDVAKHAVGMHEGSPDDIRPVFGPLDDPESSRARPAKRGSPGELRRSPRKRSRTSSTSARLAPGGTTTRSSSPSASGAGARAVDLPAAASTSSHLPSRRIAASSSSPPASRAGARAVDPPATASTSAAATRSSPPASRAASVAPSSSDDSDWISIHIGSSPLDAGSSSRTPRRSPRKPTRDFVRRVQTQPEPLSPLPESPRRDEEEQPTYSGATAGAIYTPDGVAEYVRALTLEEWEELRAVRDETVDTREQGTQVRARTATQSTQVSVQPRRASLGTQTSRPVGTLTRTLDGGAHAELPDGSTVTIRGPLDELHRN